MLLYNIFIFIFYPKPNLVYLTILWTGLYLSVLNDGNHCNYNNKNVPGLCPLEGTIEQLTI